MAKTLEEQDLEERIKILTFYGQIPIILFTVLGIIIIGGTQSNTGSQTSFPLSVSLALVLAILSLIVSFKALANAAEKKRKSAVLLLYLGLAITLVYLFFLVQLSNGNRSPFVHLYLYTPAVVFIIAHARERIRAEIITAIMCFTFYLLNHFWGNTWLCWLNFMEGERYWIFEVVFIGYLLLFLLLIDVKIDSQTDKIKNTVK